MFGNGHVDTTIRWLNMGKLSVPERRLIAVHYQYGKKSFSWIRQGECLFEECSVGGWVWVNAVECGRVTWVGAGEFGRVTGIFGATLGHYGVNQGSFQVRCSLICWSICDICWVDQGSIWDQFGIIWDQFWKNLVSEGPPTPPSDNWGRSHRTRSLGTFPPYYCWNNLITLQH